MCIYAKLAMHRLPWHEHSGHFRWYRVLSKWRDINEMGDTGSVIRWVWIVEYTVSRIILDGQHNVRSLRILKSRLLSTIGAICESLNCIWQLLFFVFNEHKNSLKRESAHQILFKPWLRAALKLFQWRWDPSDTLGFALRPQFWPHHNLLESFQIFSNSFRFGRS